MAAIINLFVQGGKDAGAAAGGGGLTEHQALCCEKLGECLWPTEKLSVEEISRRLLLEYLLWAESERGLESVRA